MGGLPGAHPGRAAGDGRARVFVFRFVLNADGALVADRAQGGQASADGDDAAAELAGVVRQADFGDVLEVDVEEARPQLADGPGGVITMGTEPAGIQAGADRGTLAIHFMRADDIEQHLGRLLFGMILVGEPQALLAQGADQPVALARIEEQVAAGGDDLRAEAAGDLAAAQESGVVSAGVAGAAGDRESLLGQQIDGDLEMRIRGPARIQMAFPEVEAVETQRADFGEELTEAFAVGSHGFEMGDGGAGAFAPAAGQLVTGLTGDVIGAHERQGVRGQGKLPLAILFGTAGL